MSKAFFLYTFLPAIVWALFLAANFFGLRSVLVQGLVIDSERGTPVAGALVDIIDYGTIQTDATGHFTVRTHRRPLHLRASAPAYRPSEALCAAPARTFTRAQCPLSLVPTQVTVSLRDALDAHIIISEATVFVNDRPSLQVDGQHLSSGVRFPAIIRVEAPGYHLLVTYCTGECTLELDMAPLIVRGIVVAADTGQPLQGAHVILNGHSLQTESEGLFAFARVRMPAQLLASRAGFESWQREILTDSQLPQDNLLRIALEPIYVSGIVVDRHTGQFIAGAHIVAGAQNTQANSQGRFRLRALEPGTRVEVQASDYFPETTTYHSQVSLILALQRNWVQVAVRDQESGQPIAGARVASHTDETYTDIQGQATLRNISPGSEILIQATDYFSAAVNYRGEPYVLVPLHQIIGEIKVHDGLTGHAIAGARVEMSGRSSETDINGLARMIGLLPGMTVTVTAPFFRPLETVFFSDSPLELSLMPASVLLRVIDSQTGDPIPGLRCSRAGAPLTVLPTGVIEISDWDPDAVFEFRAAGYRKYRLSLTLHQRPIYQGSESPVLSVGEYSPGAQPILVLQLPRFYVKGIYVPFGLLTRPDAVQELIRMVAETELNAIVVDMKGDRGYLGYQSRLPLAIELGLNRRDVLDIRELLRQCQEAGIYTIARQVVFKDHPLATGQPAWAVLNAEGTPWIDREGLAWANPYLEEVREHNIAIAKEIADLGFDEIQFDYLRFPSDGDVSAIRYAQESTLDTRTAAITAFVERAAHELQPSGIFISADVFGLTIWVDPAHDMGIGQRVQDIVPFVDYLCPMIYPSTFGSGNLGYERPADYPYEVIFRSVKQAISRVPASVRVRPWLQAYWYTMEEFLAQKRAAEEAIAWGWCFWNARGYYPEGLFAR